MRTCTEDLSEVAYAPASKCAHEFLPYKSGSCSVAASVGIDTSFAFVAVVIYSEFDE
jgi:hypothetical protein